LGNVPQSLGSASVTTSLSSTVGTVYSLVDPVPEGFSIDRSTGELIFAGGITCYGNMNTLPDTIKIKASLNPDDEKDVNIWHGRLGATYGVRMIANKENWDEDLERYYYIEENNSVLDMTIGAQNVSPTTPRIKNQNLM